MKSNSNFKTSWYDGWFYAAIIDSMSGKSFNRAIHKFIDADVSLLDIGCGTGSLCLSLADRCSHITGIDVSPKMIQYAEKTKRRGNYHNVEFILKSKDEMLKNSINRDIDIINIKLVIHEMDESGRIKLMEEAKEISKNFIFTEWHSPQPENMNGAITKIIEYIAGKEHYNNFKDWCKRGGIDGFLQRQDMEVIEERLFTNGTGKIIKAAIK